MVKSMLNIASALFRPKHSQGDEGIFANLHALHGGVMRKNVIDFPTVNSEIDPKESETPPSTISSPQFRSDDIYPALQLSLNASVDAFLAADYYSAGRSSGAFSVSFEHLNLEKSLLVRRYIKLLEESKKDWEKARTCTQMQILSVGNMSELISAQLKKIEERQEAEITAKNNELELATKKEGKILAPLLDFELGYICGVRARLFFSAPEAHGGQHG